MGCSFLRAVDGIAPLGHKYLSYVQLARRLRELVSLLVTDVLWVTAICISCLLGGRQE